MADDDARDEEMPAGDALPKDLDVTAYVGPYVFPDIRRRRIAAAIYFVLGGGALGIGLGAANGGLVLGGVILLVIAAYHFVAGWHLAVDQTEALAVASRTVGFPVGHASAQLGWRGLLSRPAWRILVYSADEPPSIRGLVELDAVDGRVLGEYTERNPEDWSKLGRNSRRTPAKEHIVKAFLADFKKFLLRGNVIDLAVAVVVGAAFNSVVQSFANDIIMGFVGAIFGQPNFSNLAVNLRGCSKPNAFNVTVCNGTIAYGKFLTTLLNFVIIGAAVFVMIKTFEKLQSLRASEVPEPAEPLTRSEELLTEIRDSLRNRAS